MPRTRKIEAELTPTAPAASAPVRRRAASASTTARKTTSPRKRTQATSEIPVVVEAITETVEAPITPVAEVILETPVAEVVLETAVVETVSAPPTREQIAALAYSYWVKRGYQGGSPEQDWLRAERELSLSVALA